MSSKGIRLHSQSVAVQTLGAILVAVLLVATPATSDPVVYHSPEDDGEPPEGIATLPPGGVESVYLYVSIGEQTSAPGTPCLSGSGGEVCGFALHLEGEGDLSLVSFDEDAQADVVVNFSPNAVSIIGLDATTPSPGPKRIGELLVNTSFGGSLDLSKAEVVGADLDGVTLPASQIVLVPEPSRAVMLVTGVASLLIVGRRRIRT